ncbi:DUF1348 family protein [Erwinia tasmaniensis]
MPPLTCQSAIEIARLAEDGWDSRSPQKVSQAWTADKRW